jgi:MOSC domain-containing protein YiiM
MTGTVLQVFTAPARGAPMEPQPLVTAVAESGLSGDRYALAKNRRGPDYQVTLIEIENIEAYRLAIDPAFSADLPRRNIVTRHVRLNDLCGRQFRVGGAVFEGLELCEPCSLMARRIRRDVLQHFLHRGGLRARIIAGGQIRPGDEVYATQAELAI